MQLKSLTALQKIQTKAYIAKESHLKVYLNVMYYLLFVPFKIYHDTNSDEYILSSNRIQKVYNVITFIN